MATVRFHNGGDGAVIRCEGCARCTPPAPRPGHAPGFIGPVRIVRGLVPSTTIVPVAWRPVVRMGMADIKAVTGACPEACLIRRPAGKTFQRGAGSDPFWQRRWSKSGTTGVTTATPSSRLADRTVRVRTRRFGLAEPESLSSIMTEPYAADGGN